MVSPCGGRVDPLIDFTATLSPVLITWASAARGTRRTVPEPRPTASAHQHRRLLDRHQRSRTAALLAGGPGRREVRRRPALQIEDVTGKVATFEFETGGGVAAGNIPIPINAAWRHPEIARHIEQAIHNNNNANNPNPAAAEQRSESAQRRFGWPIRSRPVRPRRSAGAGRSSSALQLFNTPPHADGERIVVIRNIARFEESTAGSSSIRTRAIRWIRRRTATAATAIRPHRGESTPAATTWSRSSRSGGSWSPSRPRRPC